MVWSLEIGCFDYKLGLYLHYFKVEHLEPRERFFTIVFFFLVGPSFLPLFSKYLHNSLFVSLLLILVNFKLGWYLQKAL